MDAFLGIMNGFRSRANFLLSKKNNTGEYAPDLDNLFYTRDILKSSNHVIGEYTYGKPIIFEWDEGAILKIGKFCSIADNVKIFLGGNHRTDWVSTYPFNVLVDNFPNATGIKGHPSTKGNVEIGNDVWIGRGTTIMSGVKIGDGAVLGAESLIAKNVEPYTIVAGNPGKVLRKRFDDDVIDGLLKIKWWNWPVSKINEEVRFICSENVEEFLTKYTFENINQDFL